MRLLATLVDQCIGAVGLALLDAFGGDRQFWHGAGGGCGTGLGEYRDSAFLRVADFACHDFDAGPIYFSD